MVEQPLGIEALIKRQAFLEVVRLQAEVARLQAVISICRKQECNVFVTLRNLFAFQPVSLLTR